LMESAMTDRSSRQSRSGSRQTSDNSRAGRSELWRVPLRGALLFLVLFPFVAPGQEPAANAEALWKKLEPWTKPPTEFEGKFGPFKSPLKFADGSEVKTPADWKRRRAELVKLWHKRLGPWPAMVEKPLIKKLETVERDGYTEHKVTVQISPT